MKRFLRFSVFILLFSSLAGNSARLWQGLVFSQTESEQLFLLDLKSGQVSPGNFFALILVNGRAVFRLFGTTEEEALKRADDVRQRLKVLIEMGMKGEDFSLGKYQGNVVIVAKKYLVVTVGKKEAKEAGLTLHALGQAWLENLKQALIPPTFFVESGRLIVPLGETRILRPAGTAIGPVAFSYDVALAEISFDDVRNEIRIKGQTPGLMKVTATRQTMSRTFEIKIMKYAGSVSSKLSLTVTGDPAPKHVILDAARKFIRQAVTLEPDARLSVLENEAQCPDNIASGKTEKAYLPVYLTGEEYLPYRGTVEVEISHEVLMFKDADKLLVSNDPENITSPGLLSRVVLEKEQAGRVLFHHKNGGSNPLDLVFQVSNPNSETVRVQVISGLAGPDPSEIYAGHVATKKFLQSYLRDAGYLLELPGFSSRNIEVFKVQQNKVVSGLMQFRLLSGKSAVVEIWAEENRGNVEGALRFLGSSEVAAENMKEEGEIFKKPKVVLKTSYQMEKNWKFITIGDKALTSTKGKKLLGNYGVMYEVRLELKNPTPGEKKAELLFSPAGGPAQGVFFINGEMVETGLGDYSKELTLKTYVLHPEEKKELFIKMFPQSGSFYPVRLVVRTVD